MRRTLVFPRYDALLNTDVCDARNNAELTLTLRLGFRQINPGGTAAEGTYHDYGDATAPTRKIIRWTPSAWASWKHNFVRSAQAFWNGKFWLINHLGYFGYRAGRQIFLPNIWCRFVLQGSDANIGSHHHTIDVVRLHPSENWFGSHSTLYDSLDTNSVRKGTDSHGQPIMQRAHVHEVGHLLGLGHVAIGQPGCPANGNTNASACYGTNDHDQYSVMGEGMQLRPEHAQPWIDAMRQFVATEPPSTVYTIPAPTITQLPQRMLDMVFPFTAVMRRHYPRTPAELEARQMITSRH